MIFIKENWFKFAIIIMFFLFLNTLTSGTITINHEIEAGIDSDINVNGNIDSNYSEIDGSTIYSR